MTNAELTQQLREYKCVHAAFDFHVEFAHADPVKLEEQHD